MNIKTKTKAPQVAAAGPVDVGSFNTTYRVVPISPCSRLNVRLFRLVMKPLLGQMPRAKRRLIVRTPLRMSAMPWPDTAGLALECRSVSQVPSHVFGSMSNSEVPAVLFEKLLPETHLTRHNVTAFLRRHWREATPENAL